MFILNVFIILLTCFVKCTKGIQVKGYFNDCRYTYEETRRMPLVEQKPLPLQSTLKLVFP